MFSDRMQNEKEAVCFGYRHGAEVPEEKQEGQARTEGPIDQYLKQECQEWVISMEVTYTRSYI